MAFSPDAFFSLVASSALPACLQINDQVRRGDLLAKIIEVAIVGVEFLIVEVERSEKLVFFKDVIGNDRLVRARSEIERAQLFEPPDQERKLRLECRAGFALVERFQKRVVSGSMTRCAASRSPRTRASVLFPTRMGPSTAM